MEETIAYIYAFKLFLLQSLSFWPYATSERLDVSFIHADIFRLLLITKQITIITQQHEMVPLRMCLNKRANVSKLCTHNLFRQWNERQKMFSTK